MTTNGGDVVFVVNSFLSGIRMGKRSTTGGGPFMLFHLNAPESGEGSARVKSPAEMRGVRRRVRLCRKCRRRQVRSAAGHTRAIRRAPLIRAAFRGWERK